MGKKSKITRYRKRFHINIGIIVFALVLIYFAVYVIHYLVEKKVTVYEVQTGQITEDNSYTGLILRKEKVYYAKKSGEVNYYKKEADKIAYGNIICSIDQDGTISKQITNAGSDASNLSENDLNGIETEITDYSTSYSPLSFYNVYSFKDNVNSLIQEDLYLNKLDQLSSQTSSAISGNTFTFVKASVSGDAAFYTDGYESITASDFKKSMFDPASYKKNNLKENTSVAKGQAVYKLATSEYWNMVIPISKSEASEYSKLSVLNVTFRLDGNSTYATVKTKKINSSYYLILKFNTAMVRYLSERYMDVELQTEDTNGLKIPNSAITSKKFFLVPKDYVTKGNDSSSNGVIKVGNTDGTKQSPEVISTDLYYEKNGYYYLEEDGLKSGDIIQKPGSSEEYSLGKQAYLKGVYNINKGYAVFKVIDILAHNEEYSIVKTGTDYGLALYDRIALDSQGIKDGDFIK